MSSVKGLNLFGGHMGKVVAPEVIAERTLEVVQQIARHIVNVDDPRSVYGFNLWFKNRYLNVYMRQGRRINMVTRAWVNTLEISSVVARTERKGYFTSFLNQMEKLAHQNKLNILVENVHNEHLQAFMLKRGYEEYTIPGDAGGPPTYWQV
jgi:hypothetical protein